MLNKYKVSVWKDKKFLELDGDCCKVMRMYLMPQDFTLKLTDFVLDLPQ
jgi:hypothetical protein